jgi:hypothetical protein
MTTRTRLVLGLLLVGGVAGWWGTRRWGALRVDRIHVAEAPGLRIRTAALTRGWHSAGTVVAAYADVERFRPVVVSNPDREAIAAIAPEAPWVMNGSFFTPQAEPTGLLVSEGTTLHPFIGHGGPAGSGVLTLGDGVQLHRREGFRPAEGFEFAIQAGPRIIEPGGQPGIYRDDGRRANRTVLGQSADGRLVMLVIHCQPGLGPSLFELVSLLQSPALGPLRVALNLDGGNSTGVRARLGDLDLALGEGATVPYGLALVERAP